jgi:hypothetical protein
VLDLIKIERLGRIGDPALAARVIHVSSLISQDCSHWANHQPGSSNPLWGVHPMPRFTSPGHAPERRLTANMVGPFHCGRLVASDSSDPSKRSVILQIARNCASSYQWVECTWNTMA